MFFRLAMLNKYLPRVYYIIKSRGDRTGMMIEPTNIIDNYRILSQVAHSNFSSTYIAERTHARKPLVLITLWHGITLTTREDVQTFLKKARHGVFFKNAQRIPLLD